MESEDDPVDPFADLPGEVGDDREKFVRVTLANGEQVEHGNTYVRYTDEEFILADSMEFAEDETTRYRKGEVVQVEVQQHHPKCFISTAVADTPTLNILRGFRNDVMAGSVIGRILLRIYDIVSPPIARKIARTPHSRTAKAVKWFVTVSAALERERRRRSFSSWLAVAVMLLYTVGLVVAMSGALAMIMINSLSE